MSDPRLQTLAGLCDLVTEQIDPATAPEALYVGLEHLTPGRLLRSGGGLGSEVQSNKFAFRKGDVLYGKLRPYLDKAVLADSDGVCTTELLVLRPKAGVDPRFLACVVHDSDFIDHAMAGVTGAHHPRTSWSHIAQFPALEFDKNDQNRIATLLWRIHDLLKANESSHDSAGKLKRAAMRELFTRGLRGETQKDTEIGLVPEGWSVERLDNFARVISTRMSYSELESAENDLEGAVRVVGIKVSDMNRVGNESVITSAALEKTLNERLAASRCAPPGTIVFPKRGAAIATNKKRLTNTWSVFDPNVIGVVPNDPSSAGFLYHWFQLFDLRTITEPGPTPQLNKKHLDPLLVPAPSTTDERRDIAAVLDALDHKIKLNQQKRTVLEELFKSLLHSLLTGEIRAGDLDLSAIQQSEAVAA